MSTFGGLHIAGSALYASQKAVEVISKNIANANTTGYTRQQIVLTPAINNVGVEVVGVEQVRENFVDTQYRNETSKLGEWQVKTDALTTMEDFLQEPSDYGLNQAFDNFFDSLQEMAKQPETKEMRSQVLQNALALTDTMHYIYTELTDLQKNLNQEVNTTVNQINDYAKNIQELNSQIQQAEQRQAGQKANELRDQRNIFIDQLSELVNISSNENPDGTVTVTLGGTNLVDGSNINLISSVADKTNPISGEGNLYSLKWEDGTDVTVTGGKLKGYLDIRDGAGVTGADDPKYLGIAYFTNKLNMLAKSVAKSINDLHSTGYTMPNQSNGYTSQTGINFFNPPDVNTVNAKNISVAQEIMDNVYNIASSDKVINSTNAGNSNIVKQIANLRDSTNINVTLGTDTYTIGSFNGYTKEITSELAIVSAQSNNRLEAQQVVQQSALTKRQSTSGVSIDEEMTNLIMFQNAYSAAARVMNAIDKNVETLINMIG